MTANSVITSTTADTQRTAVQAATNTVPATGTAPSMARPTGAPKTTRAEAAPPSTATARMRPTATTRFARNLRSLGISSAMSRLDCSTDMLLEALQIATIGAAGARRPLVGVGEGGGEHLRGAGGKSGAGPVHERADRLLRQPQQRGDAEEGDDGREEAEEPPVGEAPRKDRDPVPLGVPEHPLRDEAPVRPVEAGTDAPVGGRTGRRPAGLLRLGPFRRSTDLRCRRPLGLLSRRHRWSIPRAVRARAPASAWQDTEAGRPERRCDGRR